MNNTISNGVATNVRSVQIAFTLLYATGKKITDAVEVTGDKAIFERTGTLLEIFSDLEFAQSRRIGWAKVEQLTGKAVEQAFDANTEEWVVIDQHDFSCSTLELLALHDKWLQVGGAEHCWTYLYGGNDETILAFLRPFWEISASAKFGSGSKPALLTGLSSTTLTSEETTN